jgi:hypothetical protein
VASSSQLDPHQQAVYRWEDSWPGWNKNTIGIKDCREVIRRACKWYKVQPPTVVHHNVRAMSFSVPTKNYISLQGGEHRENGGRNVATALHEAAHHIAWALYGERVQDHGRTWLGIYLCLLVRGRVAPQVALEASARAAGLKWTYPKIDRVRPRAAG